MTELPDLSRYRPRMMSWALRMVQDREDAEDLVQDALYQAYRALPKFRGESAMESWLYRILHNRVLNWSTVRRREHERIAFSLDTLLPEQDPENVHHSYAPLHGEWPDEALDPARLLANAELGRVVREAIAKLPKDLRRAVVLRDLENLRYDEASALLRVSEPCFKTRLHRGRIMLRAALEAYQKGLPPPEHEAPPPEPLPAQDILAGLPLIAPLWAEAVRLRDVEQLSYREIGACLGIEPDLACRRIRRGHQALRRLHMAGGAA